MRHLAVLLTLALLLPAVAPVAAPAMPLDNIVSKKSRHGVTETIDRLVALLQQKDIPVIARLDHAAGAKRVGATLPPTEVLMFGNPAIGTPLMTAERRIGLDLPMRVLAWQDDAGSVWLTYRAPSDLRRLYRLEGRDEVFAKMERVLDELTEAAAQ